MKRLRSSYDIFFLFIFTILGISLVMMYHKRNLNIKSVSGTFTNPIFRFEEQQPWAVWHKGYYYLLLKGPGRLLLYKGKDITSMDRVSGIPKREILIRPEYKDVWGQRMFYIEGKWYIYFAGDDGNSDNRQLYVLENKSEDPFKGTFEMKGLIDTDKNRNWSILPDVFQFNNQWYIIWSGWVSRREYLETQCIFIAKLRNPWTVSSERILISKPEYEWERQWINPDGSKREYPIHVNESPVFFYKPGSANVCILYSASGCWTSYYCIGLLTAPVDGDLMSPSSWKKNEWPIFKQSKSSHIFGPGNPCIIPSPDLKEYFLLYSATNAPITYPDGSRPRMPRLQKINFFADGTPVLGVPVGDSIPMAKPSGID
jgi:GH43 family beta-xylosidase